MEWSRCLVTWTPSPTHQHCQRHFYRRFLPGAANIHCPLTEALKGNPKVLSWTAEMQAPTTAIKAVLVAAVPVSHPLPATQLSLATDASDSHISGVLQQREVGGALSLLVSTVESCLKQSAGTLLLTGNCWQPSTPAGIFMHQRCPACARVVQYGGTPSVASPSCPCMPDGHSSVTTCSQVPCSTYSLLT